MNAFAEFSTCIRCVGLMLFLSMAVGGGTVSAEDVTMGGSKYRIPETLGSDEYRVSCLNCHGEGGKGDGPMMDLLTKKPSDLTVLAKNNGGEYPFVKVYQTIDGRVTVPGHGTREMPVWGREYRSTVLRQGESGAFDFGPSIANARIASVVDSLYRIQEP